MACQEQRHQKTYHATVALARSQQLRNVDEVLPNSMWPDQRPLPDPHDICRSARLRKWLRSLVCGPPAVPFIISAAHDTGRASNACRLIMLHLLMPGSWLSYFLPCNPTGRDDVQYQPAWRPLTSPHLLGMLATTHTYMRGPRTLSSSWLIN